MGARWSGQSSDYLLKAVVPDMEYYEKFLLGRLTRIAGVTGVHFGFELRRWYTAPSCPGSSRTRQVCKYLLSHNSQTEARF